MAVLRALAGVLLVAGLAWWARHRLAGLDLPELLERIRARGPAGVAALAVAFAVAPLLALPTAPLSVAAGWLYGPLPGAALSTAAGTRGAVGAFLVGRTVARPLVLGLAARRPALGGLLEHVRERGLRMILCLRLSPVMPFPILNFVFGATRLRARDYLAGSLVGSAPAILCWTALGATLARLGHGASLEELGGTAWLLGGAAAATAVAVVSARRALARDELEGSAGRS